MKNKQPIKQCPHYRLKLGYTTMMERDDLCKTCSHAAKRDYLTPCHWAPPTMTVVQMIQEAR